MDDIEDKTLQALDFYISTTEYLKKRSSHFIDITDLELTAKLVIVDNPVQVIRNFEEEMVKMKNECAAKKKERLAKLYTPVGSFLYLCFECFLFLLPYSMPILLPIFVPVFLAVLLPVLLSAPVPALLSYFGSSIVLLSGYVPAPVIISCCRIPAFMLLFPLLSLPLSLEPLLLRIFKQSLSDKP